MCVADEHLRHLAAHVEGSEFTEGKELTDPLHVRSVDVGLPLQSVANGDAQVLVLLIQNSSVVETSSSSSGPPPSLWPRSESGVHYALPLLPSVPYTPDHCRVIRELLQTAGHRVVLEVGGAQGRETGRLQYH